MCSFIKRLSNKITMFIDDVIPNDSYFGVDLTLRPVSSIIHSLTTEHEKQNKTELTNTSSSQPGNPMNTPGIE